MLNLQMPSIEHRTVYEKARERFRDESYKSRLVGGQDEVLRLGVGYESLAKSGRLSTIPKEGGVPPFIHPGDMQKLYNEGLLRKNSDARKIYEKIKLSSPFRVCPFCIHRTVKTLDHYLPKKKYGAYSVLPSNLIPCCRDCNSEKDEFKGVNRVEEIIHPYFDSLDSFSWLGCELKIENGICVPIFFIDSSVVSSQILSRLTSHMQVLQLFELYDVEGAREINDILELLQKTFNKSGEVGVRELCEDMAASRAKLAHNYWRASLWRAAALDDTFCSLQWL